MRTSSPTEAIEQLLCALYEGTASDGPWIDHNGAAWEMGDLAYDDRLDEFIPYRWLLANAASTRVHVLTRQTAQAVRDAAEALLCLLDTSEAQEGQVPTWKPQARI